MTSAVGDAWWKYLSAQQSSAPAVSAHCASLYRSALDSLTGLRRSVVEKRIAELAKAGGTPAASVRSIPQPAPSSGMTTFMGISQPARKVVFLCDASGSMMTVLPQLKQELYKSIDKLTDAQQYELPEMFEYDRQAALSWGQEHLAASGYRRHHDDVPAVIALAQMLSQDEKLQLLQHMTPDSYDDDLFDAFVGDDAELYRRWLCTQPPSSSRKCNRRHCGR